MHLKHVNTILLLRMFHKYFPVVKVYVTDFPFVNVYVTDFPVVKAYVTDFPVLKVYADGLSFARIWPHKLCATLFANVNINYRLPIKVY